MIKLLLEVKTEFLSTTTASANFFTASSEEVETSPMPNGRV